MPIVKTLILAAFTALFAAACQGESSSEESAPAQPVAAAGEHEAEAASGLAIRVCNGWRDGFTCPSGQWCADFDCDGSYHCTTGIGAAGSCCIINAGCASGVCNLGGQPSGHCQ